MFQVQKSVVDSTTHADLLKSTAPGLVRPSPRKHFPWGVVQGRIELPQDVLEGARESGLEAYRLVEAGGFVSDRVDILHKRPWMRAVEALLPLKRVRELGFETEHDHHLFGKCRPTIYFTYGVESHTDDEGPSLILVLANDGLKFWQGRCSHVTQPGEWFIFDDRKPHGVRETKRSTAYVFCQLTLAFL